MDMIVVEWYLPMQINILYLLKNKLKIFIKLNNIYMPMYYNHNN